MIRARELWSSLMPKFKKRHPALKHGGYSATALLPGENPAEFEELHQALIAELGLAGALEEDIGADLARLVWRKQNLATINLAEQAQAHWRRISGPNSSLRWSDSDRAKVDAAIQADRDQAVKDLGEAFRLVELDETATVECLLKELEIEERLDALIDKCLKRLLLVRGLKSLPTASSSAPTQPIAEPRRMARPTRAA